MYRFVRSLDEDASMLALWAAVCFLTSMQLPVGVLNVVLLAAGALLLVPALVLVARESFYSVVDYSHNRRGDR
jgi:hypothetical protein